MAGKLAACICACDLTLPSVSRRSDQPDPAFLPMPDNETAGRAAPGAGIAFASIKQRRISTPLGPSAASSPLAHSAAAHSAAGSFGGGFTGTLSRFGSAVSSLMGANPSMAGAAAEAVLTKEH